jgi:hypothetical protein
MINQFDLEIMILFRMDMMRGEVFLMRYFPMRPPIVSLGLLSDYRTQDWGTTKFYFKRNKGTRKKRKNGKKINICVF